LSEDDPLHRLSIARVQSAGVWARDQRSQRDSRLAPRAGADQWRELVPGQVCDSERQ